MHHIFPCFLHFAPHFWWKIESQSYSLNIFISHKQHILNILHIPIMIIINLLSILHLRLSIFVCSLFTTRSQEIVKMYTILSPIPHFFTLSIIFHIIDYPGHNMYNKLAFSLFHLAFAAVYICMLDYMLVLPSCLDPLES